MPGKSYTARVTGAWGGQEDRRKRVQDLEREESVCLKEKPHPGWEGAGTHRYAEHSWVGERSRKSRAAGLSTMAGERDSDRGRVSQRAVDSPQKTGRESVGS